MHDSEMQTRRLEAGDGDSEFMRCIDPVQLYTGREKNAELHACSIQGLSMRTILCTLERTSLSLRGHTYAWVTKVGMRVFPWDSPCCAMTTDHIQKR